MATSLEEEMSVLDDKIGKCFDQDSPDIFHLARTECLQVTVWQITEETIKLFSGSKKRA